MNENDLVQLFFGRFDTFQTLWSLYLTVVFGLFAFLTAAEKAMRSWIVRVILSCGFTFFALTNWYALYRVSIQRVALSEAILEKLKESPSQHLDVIVQAGLPSSSVELAAFHFIIDAAAILLILVLPIIRARVERSANKPIEPTG